ncbi:unnamed protein product [Pleuronectes platessa]|uniref:Uncharacterized protein n=1 Tax=Pleuronectes platessa TaxID=8262 RepID=A0A9N7V286_PLEPL|nr:unnamed protein product [Pleuronectes platessa]
MALYGRLVLGGYTLAGNICQRRQSLKWDTASACVLPSLICLLSTPPPSIALWPFWERLSVTNGKVGADWECSSEVEVEKEKEKENEIQALKEQEPETRRSSEVEVNKEKEKEKVLASGPKGDETAAGDNSNCGTELQKGGGRNELEEREEVEKHLPHPLLAPTALTLFLLLKTNSSPVPLCTYLK